MDADQYQSLLFDFMNGQGQQKEITDLLMKMCESNILEFLRLNLLVFSKFQDPSLCNITITLIYVQARKGTIFLSNEVATTFWTNFAQIIPDSFQSEILPDHSKYLISSIISYFATNFYQLCQDTQIQNFILTLFEQNPIFEPYIINSIEEIVISSHDFGGFSLEALIKIITMNPLRYEASIIPRIKLYFSVVMRIFKNEDNENTLGNMKTELENLFPQLFQATPPSQLEKMISTTSLFAETFAEFFEPQLPTFIPLICKFAEDSTCPFRNSAIFCLESFTKGSINMCSSLESYYIPVISSLIRIMAEINENAPLEEDPNDTASYIIANNAIRSFLIDCPNQSVYTHISNFFQKTVVDIAGSRNVESTFIYEAVPWPLMHAFIYALSYQNIKIIRHEDDKSADIDTDNDNDDEIECESGVKQVNKYVKNYIELTVSLLPFLTNPNSDPHLKKAVYDLISSYSKSYVYTFYKFTSEGDLVSILMHNILNESNISLQKSCAAALKNYIGNGFGNLIDSHYNNVFVFISQNLPNFPLHLLTDLIQVLKYFVSIKVQERHPEVMNVYITTIIDLYVKVREKSATNNEFLDLQVELFISLVSIFENKAEHTMRINLFYGFQGIPEKVVSMLNDCIVISDQNRCKDEVRLKKAIIKCIVLLNENSLPLIQQYNILNRSVEAASKDITIYKYFQFDMVEEDMSMLTKIESNDSTSSTGTKFYVLSTEQEEVKLALKTLLNIVPILKPNFLIEMIENLVQICQKWITNVYRIEKLMNCAWLILVKMVWALLSHNQVQILISCFTDDFVNFFRPFESTKHSHKILSAMNNFISHELINPASIPMVFEKVSNLVDDLFNQISQCNNDFLNYKLISKNVFDEELMPVRVSLLRDLLEDITSFFDFSLKKYSNETVAFFDQIYLQKVNAYLTKPESFEFALRVKTYYIIRVKDVQAAVQLITCFFNLFTKFLKQVSEQSIYLMAKIFRHVELPTEFVCILYQAFQEFFKKDELIEFTEYSDLAIGAFSVLIKYYEEQFRASPPVNVDSEDSDLVFENLYDNAIYTFIKAFPIWQETQLDNEAFDLVATLMEEQNRFIMDIYEFHRIWINIIFKIDDKQFMSNSVSLRFKNIIKSITHNPQYHAIFEALFSDFIDTQKQAWMRFSEEALPANVISDDYNYDYENYSDTNNDEEN